MTENIALMKLKTLRHQVVFEILNGFGIDFKRHYFGVMIQQKLCKHTHTGTDFKDWHILVLVFVQQGHFFGNTFVFQKMLTEVFFGFY